MILIDGSVLEGGGQIIRTATALSAATGKEVEIYNIRKNREPSGLKTQHTYALNAIKEFCNAEVEGAEIGSERIKFSPGEITKKALKIKIPTAGSVTLALQNIIPVAVLTKTPIKIEAEGGTHVNWSPPADYFKHIFCYFMEKMGNSMKFEIKKYGFYPKGGGKVILDIKKTDNEKFDFTETGKLERVDVHSIATTHLEKARVAERQLTAFKKEFIKEVKGKEHYVESLSPGSCIHAHAHYENAVLGTEVLGEKGLPSEKAGEQCALNLKKELEKNAPVDKYMTDQLIPFMIPGSKLKATEITLHTKTNIWVCEQFLKQKYVIKNNVIICKTQ